MSRDEDVDVREPAGARAEPVLVRNLRPADFEAVLRIDEKLTGRRRDGFYELKLQQNLVESGIKVSLAAELDGAFVGFLLARVFYGEFGLTEPTAVLETLAVHPDFRKQGVGGALLGQLCTNLRGVGVRALQTQVSWDDQELLAFFHARGFRPAERLCLDLELGAPGRDAVILNLNKSTRYALYAALEMAEAADGEPVTAAGVAERYGIPAANLAKVFQRLVHSGLAVGIRGSRGGYRLARAPSEVTVLDVIEALEAPPTPDVCLLLVDPGERCRQPGPCRLKRLFGEVDELARSTFASVTLQTLLGTRPVAEAPAER